MCFTETWLHAHFPNRSASIPGSKTLRANRDTPLNKEGAVFLNETWDFLEQVTAHFSRCVPELHSHLHRAASVAGRQNKCTLVVVFAEGGKNRAYNSGNRFVIIMSTTKGNARTHVGDLTKVMESDGVLRKSFRQA